ncbi:MAG: hypothetical protein V1720_18760 [bacterium]
MLKIYFFLYIFSMGFAASLLASRKTRNVKTWFVIGLILGLPAVILLIFKGKRNTEFNFANAERVNYIPLKRNLLTSLSSAGDNDLSLFDDRESDVITCPKCRTVIPVNSAHCIVCNTML